MNDQANPGRDQFPETFKNILSPATDQLNNSSVQDASGSKDRKNLLSSVLDPFILGYTEIDAEGRIIYVSEGICTISGYKEEELIGKNISAAFFPPDVFEQAEQIRQKRMEAGHAPFTYEIEIALKDGTRRWIWTSAINRFDQHGNDIGSIGIHVDVTDQRKALFELTAAKRAAEEAQQAQQRFLASMSHEIRTPLNAIIGMSYLLQDTKFNTEQEEYIKILKNASNILLGLITDILDMAKIEAGKVEVKLREFDLHELVNTLKYTFQYKLKNKPIRVSYIHDDRIKNMIVGDDVLLNQVLMNLLGNAEKFTAKGEIGIEIRLIRQEGDRLWLEFKVWDSGIGIPQDKLQVIFQDFRQADQDIQERYGGSGLGLSICKRLIEIQGGNIRVESELGKGTNFIFTLSYMGTSRRVKVVNHLSREEDDEIAFEGVRILLVEDNPMNLKYLSSLMEKFHIQYVTATNGADALWKIRHEHFDLMLMDIKIPGVEGLEIARRIRNEDNPNRATPIVMLTAIALAGTVSAAHDVGVNDLLTKPYTPDQLLRLLKKYLSEDESVPEEPEMGETTAFAFNPMLDTAYLRKLYGDNFEYAAELFQLFVSCIEKELKDIRLAMERRDWERMRSQVHKIKPNFSMAGLTWLTKSMQGIYNKLHAKDYQDVPQLMNTVLRDFEIYLPVIREEQARLQAFLKDESVSDQR